MIKLIEDNQAQIVSICQRLGIARLDVFGSAARDDFDDAKSDIDFVVEFDLPGSGGLLARYLELAEQLEGVLGRTVDLVTSDSIRNPYFAEGVRASREVVYAA